MRKQLLGYFTALCSMASFTAAAQQLSFNWVKTMGGTGNESGESVTLDLSGNIYTTGKFTGTPDFDPGSGTYNMTATGNTTDAYLTKFDASGNFLWAVQTGGPGYEDGFDVITDAAGNSYATGMFQDSVDFDPGPAVLNKYSSNAGRNAFVTKRDAAGNLLWAVAFDTTLNSKADGYSLALDAAGNLYIAGSFEGTVDFNPDTATYTMTAVQGSYVVKLNSNGSFLWARQFGGIGVGSGVDIKLDSVMNMYITGTFSGTADFDPGVGVTNLTSAGNADIFVCKLDSSAQLTWARKFGGTAADFGTALAVDSAGNVYSTGQFTNTADFDPGTSVYNLVAPGNYSTYVSKLNAGGNFVWAKVIAYNSYGGDLLLDAAANIYSTGAAAGGDFDPGPGTFNINANGLTDTYVHKLDASGNFAWAVMFGGTSIDGGVGIAQDMNGNIYTAGTFAYTPDFDITANTYTVTSVSNSPDVFVHKMGESSLGAPETAGNTTMQLYPNPTEGIISLNVNGQTDNSRVKITDLAGRILLEQALTAGITTFDLSHYEAGLYMVTVVSGNRAATAKVLVTPH